MSIEELHNITSGLIRQGKGDSTVAIDFATFMESENATILPIESWRHTKVQGADDSGPVGERFAFLVLSGTR